MQIDAMEDTDSSSDKEICKVDKHKLTIRKEEEPPVMPHQHHGLVQGWQQGTHKRVDEGRDFRSGLHISPLPREGSWSRERPFDYDEV